MDIHTELTCDQCQKHLGLMLANDLEGSYFYCNLECAEAHFVILETERLKRQAREADEWARRVQLVKDDPERYLKLWPYMKET